MLEVLETDLIQRAQQGDAEVIGALYEQYYRHIFRYLYYRVGDPGTAEDLTSEVFLRMLSFLKRYRSERSRPKGGSAGSPFQAWLFQIARNLAIDHYRKMSLRDHAQLEENLASPEDDPDGQLHQGLTSQALRQALSRLLEDQRDVVVLRFVVGLPVQQVAQTLHKSEDSVKGLQRRGLIALRTILKEWEITYV